MDGVVDQPQALGTQPPVVAPPMMLIAPRAAEPRRLWDFGHAAGAEAVAAEDDFGELARMEASSKRTRMLGSLVLLLVALGVSYGAYELYFNNHNLLDELFALFGESPPEEAAPVFKPKQAPPPAAVVAKKGIYLQVVSGNPYWPLPNRLFPEVRAAARDWTPEEEQQLRTNLEHKFPYQRYKVVQDIRSRRLAGSESLLWQGLQDQKFWTRMFAAIGLAEFQVEVSIKTLEGAMAGARSELIANFFERFVHKPNAGQLFMMRQAIRLLDERGRLVVLRALTHSKDPLRDVYLVAATLDPGKKIQAWVPKALAERGVAPQKFAQLLAVVKGDASPDVIFPGAGKVKSFQGHHSAASGVMSDEEMETQLEAADKAGGSVEFFPEAPPEPEGVKPLTDEPAAETFEYEP